MDDSILRNVEEGRGQNPILEDDTGGRGLHPEDEATYKRIVGQALEEFAPIMLSKVEQIISSRFQELEQKYPVLTKPVESQPTIDKERFEYKNFSNCKPPEFKGEINPMISLRWLSEIEETFLLCECPERLKVIYAAHQLKGSAHEWWDSKVKTYGFEAVAQFPWATFKEMFQGEYAPMAEMEKLKGEFLAIQQGNMTVTEYTRVFHDKSRFCPEYTSNPDLLRDHYYRHLNAEIREFTDPTIYDTIPKLLNKALTREKDLQSKIVEAANKQKSEGVSTLQSSSLKRSRFDNKSSSRPSKKTQSSSQTQPRSSQSQFREWPLCDKCGKRHMGDCKCFKCGRPGHVAPDCPSPLRLCYYCFKDDHLIADCPQRKESLRKIDQRKESEKKSTSGGSRSKSRAFQITAEEAKESHDVVTGPSVQRSGKEIAKE